MKTITSFRKPFLFFRSVPIVVVLAGFSSSCMQLPDTGILAGVSSTPSKSQDELLAELEANRARWAQSGAQSYTFSVARECENCPAELPSEIAVAVVIDDNRTTTKSKVSARDRSDSGFRNVNTFGDGQINTMESYFANVRQGILSNQIRNVSYDSTYGYPQQIVVGNNINPNIDAYRFSTNNFRVNNDERVSSSVLTGAFTYGANANGAGAYWLVEDSGAWNQLQVPSTLNNQLGSYSNGSRVQVVGQWAPGGLNGQGVINVNNLSALSQANSGVVNGWLTSGYNVNPGSAVTPTTAYNYSVVGSDGRVVPVNFPNNLLPQAQNWVGGQVSLSGSYQAQNVYGVQPFQANQALAFPQTPVQLSGSLAWSGGALPNSVGQTQVWLVDDAGKWNELRVPANLSNVANSYGQGTRVRVNGVYGFNQNGSAIVDVLDLGQLNNIFTDIQLAGLLEDDTTQGFAVSDAFSSRFVIASDNGSRYQLRVPTNLPSASSLRRGSRVQVLGSWTPGGFNGQGFVDARSLQVFNNTASNVTLGGLIIGRDVSTNGLNMYAFQADDGRVFRLRVSNSSGVVQQGVNLGLGGRVQVVGQLWDDINELEAQQIRPFSVFTTSTVLNGTMVNWGNVGGVSNSFILSDDNGRVWHVVYQPSFAPNIYPGLRLRVTGMADVSANHVDASLIELGTIAVPLSYVPPVPVFSTPYPVSYNTPVTTPGSFQTSVEGTFVRSNPSFTTMNVFEFRGNDGRTYTVSYQTPATLILPSPVTFTAGMRLRVSGFTDGGAGIQASSIEVLPMTASWPTGTTPYAQPTSLTGTMTRQIQFGNTGQVIELIDDSGRAWQVTYNEPGVSYVPQRMPLSSGMRLRVSSFGLTPTVGSGSASFSADVIEILSPASGFSGLGLNNLAVLNVTVTGITTTGITYGGGVPLYTYSAIDDAGQPLTLRVTGQTLSTAIFGTNLTPGSRVRITGLTTTASSQGRQVDVQRIEAIY